MAVFSGSNPDQISVTSPSHSPGSVDIVVTNVDGQSAVATGAHTFAAPDSFEVNGSWQGVSFVGDDDEPFTFTVENGSVVSITCSTSGLMRLTPPAPIIHGEFLFIGEDGVALSGRIVAPNEAKGDVTVDSVYEVRRPCVEREGSIWPRDRFQSMDASLGALCQFVAGRRVRAQTSASVREMIQPSSCSDRPP